MKTLWLAVVTAAVLVVAGERTAQARGRFSVGISIGHVDDFYEPLRPHGRWINLQPYGRCWYPSYVAADWRPYADGHWEWTDEGWYWVSDEDWGWATYHYGRWVWDPYYGWVWAPDTEWAPAWVAWREGPDYIGWAPLPPRCDYGPRGLLIVERIVWAPRAFVFVEHRHFCKPVREHVVVNQTIINQTINITKIEKVENSNVVIHNGPTIVNVEKRTGTRVQETRAADLWRQRSERVAERATESRAKAPPIVTAPTPTPLPATKPDGAERGRGRNQSEPPAAVVREPQPAVEGPRPVPPAAEKTETNRRRWTPPTIVRGPQRDDEPGRSSPPADTKVTPPTATAPETIERPSYGRRQWTPPPVTRGAEREEEKPTATERRREFTPPTYRNRVEEAPPTPPAVAPAERSPSPYGRGEERRFTPPGRDDSRGERGRRGESGSTETNAPSYSRGR